MGLISDLKYFFQLFLRRWWVVTCPLILIVAGTALYTFTRRPVYEAGALLLIEKEGENTLSQEGVKVESLQDDYYQTQYEILQSRSLVERVAKNLNLAKNPEFAGAADPAGALQTRIRILPVRRSRLVKIAAKSFDPPLAAKIANEMAHEYSVQNLEGRLFLSREVLRALEERGTISVESLPAVVNSPLIQELKTSLARLRSERAQLANRYQPLHPQMIQLNARIAETQDQLEREIGHIAQSVKIQLSGHLEGSNVRLVDRARAPKSPVYPKKRRDLAFALLLGLSLGFGLAFVIDQLDLSVRSREDLEKWVKVPFLGSIRRLPVLQEAGFEKIWAGGRSAGAEAFRNLRAAIFIRLSQFKNSTTLMVTSSIQGEGKSFVCANLARCFAQTGERVLLIDGDLRNPSQHKLFGLAADKGLSSYLAGDHPPAAAVVDTGIANFKLLPGGPVREDPTELLSDQRLKVLLHWASGEFDRIVVDSSPLLPVADALLWRKHVHGVVLIVRANRVRAAAVQRACQIVKDNFNAVLGVVLNQDAASLTTYHYAPVHGARNRSARRPPLAERQEV